MGFFASSQVKNILIPNKNYRAKELNHVLNKKEDSLLLTCERTIRQVIIFNSSYDKTIRVKDTKVGIPLNKMPVGRFLIETFLENKLIIIVLLREYRDGKIINIISENTSEEQHSVSIPSSGKSEQLGVIKNEATEVEKLETMSKIVRKPKSYWVEYTLSNGNSSSKTMRMATKRFVDKMITKNKIEIQSLKGRHNKLVIWEIYDSSKFLRIRRQSQSIEAISDSDFFNPQPYYSSVTELEKQ